MRKGHVQGHFRDRGRDRSGAQQPVRAEGAPGTHLPASLRGRMEASEGAGGGLVVAGISETTIQALDSEHTCLGSTQK